MKNNPQELKPFIKQIRGISYKPHQVIDEPKEGYIPLLRATNIIEGHLDLDNVLYVEESLVKEEQLLKKGDILIAASSGSMNAIGKSSPFNSDGNYTFGAFCKVVRPIDVHPDYIAHYFNTSLFRTTIQNQINGANIKNIKNEHIDNLRIFIPDSKKQILIVDLLNTAKRIINKRKSQIALLEELTKSLFLEMFGDPELNTKNWQIKAFDDFVIIDTNMTKDFEGYSEKYHIGIDNIEKNTGKLINLKKIRDSQLTSGKYIFNEKHVIYSKIRPYLNKVALPYFEGLCSADAYPLLPKKDICSRYFLAYLLRSVAFLNHVSQNSDRTNIPKVNKNQLKSFRGIIPPFNMQQDFEKIVLVIEEKKETFIKSLSAMEDLYNALLQESFKGEFFQEQA